MTNRTRTELTDDDKKKIIELATAILDGKIGVIDGCRQMIRVTHGIAKVGSEKALLTFIGVESETDHLLIGEARKNVAPDALAQMDADVKRSEKLYRESVFEACRRVVARFSQSNSREE